MLYSEDGYTTRENATVCMTIFPECCEVEDETCRLAGDASKFLGEIINSRVDSRSWEFIAE
jgi:hypothetical protein